MNSHDLGVLMIRQVMYEQKGWKVYWKQKCDHCGVSNTFEKYCTMVICGKCNKDYVMDNPKLLQISRM